MPAPLPAPQSISFAMCPPQARTGVETVVVNVMVMVRSASEPLGPPYAETPVMLQLKHVNSPAIWVMSSPVPENPWER